MKTSNLRFALLLAVAVGCDDSTGVVTATDLVGEWDASNYVVTNLANSSESVELVALGAELFMTFTDTSYSGTATFPGEATEAFSGTYEIDGNLLILNETDQPEPDVMTYNVADNTMMLTGNDEQYDFDDDGQDDPASFVMVLQKRAEKTKKK